MDNEFNFPDAEWDLQLLDPDELDRQPVALEADDALLPGPVEPMTAGDTLPIPVPPAMAPCPVSDCPALNLHTELKHYKHWRYSHQQYFFRFKCPAPGCRRITRRPKELQSHLRSSHGTTAAEAVTLTFVDTKKFLNPAFIDPGVCATLPGYHEWLAKVDGGYGPITAATPEQQALLTRIFGNKWHGGGRATEAKEEDLAASIPKSQRCDAGCQTNPLPDPATSEPSKARDREWIQNIVKWKASHKRQQKWIQILRKQNADLEARLRASESSLEKALDKWRTTARRLHHLESTEKRQ